MYEILPSSTGHGQDVRVFFRATLHDGRETPFSVVHHQAIKVNPECMPTAVNLIHRITLGKVKASRNVRSLIPVSKEAYEQHVQDNLNAK